MEQQDQASPPNDPESQLKRARREVGLSQDELWQRYFALGGIPVWAYWERGRLSGDPRLLTQARLLVDMGTVFVNDDPPARVAATLEGPPPAIMLTLAQACDHVKNVDFEFTAKAG